MAGVLELRSSGDGAPRLRGVASRFNYDYRVGSEYSAYSFIEDVAPKAFTKTLSRSDLDVVLCVQHSDSMPLARTPATLSLAQTDAGLEFEASLDSTDPLAQQTISRIERGVLRECSFRFTVPPGGDSWNQDRTRRTIREVDLHRGDVSLVVYGASSATGAEVVRSAESFEERRRFTAAISAIGIGGTGWAGRLPSSRTSATAMRRPAIDRELGDVLATGEALAAELAVLKGRAFGTPSYTAAPPAPRPFTDGEILREIELARKRSSEWAARR